MLYFAVMVLLKKIQRNYGSNGPWESDSIQEGQPFTTMHKTKYDPALQSIQQNRAVKTHLWSCGVAEDRATWRPTLSLIADVRQLAA